MRKYALLKNQVVDQVMLVEDVDVQTLALSAEMIVDIEDMIPQPVVGWKLSGNKLVPSVAQAIDADWIKVNKVIPIKAFVDDLLATVIAENIYMGISQSGKSGAVLNMANKSVEVASAPGPVSLYESLTNLTLTVTIDVLNYHIANIADYSDLAPFITEARLNNMKHKVQTFLGLPLT